MITPCQRWRERRTSYRPAGEPIDPRRYGVELIEERDARTFVVSHHYSGSYPATRRAVGLFRSRGAVWAPELVGVAAFSVGVQPAAIRRWCGVEPEAGIELGRFVLLDEIEANAETWFLSRAFRALRAELPEVLAVLAYSDPMRRLAADGSVVTPGHVGTIYQAYSGRYLGRASRRTLILDGSGRVISDRTLSKIRLGERGAGAAVDALIRAGAPRPRAGEDEATWLTRALSGGWCRRIRHPGNHVYAWPLERRREFRPDLAPSAGPYPKHVEAA